MFSSSIASSSGIFTRTRRHRHQQRRHEEKKGYREIGKAGKTTFNCHSQILYYYDCYDSIPTRTIIQQQSSPSCLLLSSNFNLFYNVRREMGELEQTHDLLMVRWRVFTSSKRCFVRSVERGRSFLFFFILLLQMLLLILRQLSRLYRRYYECSNFRIMWGKRLFR